MNRRIFRSLIAQALLSASLASSLQAAAVPPRYRLSAAQKKALACHCCGMDGVSPRLEQALERLQAMTRRRYAVTSGLRCVPHNTEVGGVLRSLHLTGFACDIAVPRALQPLVGRAARLCGFAVVIPSARRGYIHLALER